MKKIIGFLMAVVMCLGIITPITAFAVTEGTTAASAPVYVYEEDFTDTTIAKGNLSGAAKEPANHWFSYTDGWLTVDENNALNLYNSSGTLTAGVNIASLASNFANENFVLSFDIYRSDSTGAFILYYDYYETALCKPFFEVRDGKLRVSTDNGSTYIDTNASCGLNEWSNIAIVYNYENEKITSYSVKHNGFDVYYTYTDTTDPEKPKEVKVYDFEISTDLPQVDGWRFKTGGGKNFKIDNWTVTKGESLPYFYEQYAPLKDGYSYFYNDYENGEINDSGKINTIEAVNSTYSPANFAQSKIENGLLKLDSRNSNISGRGEYLVRLYEDTSRKGGIRITGDMTISAKFKPCEKFRSLSLMCLVKTDGEKGNFSGDINVIKVTGGEVRSNLTTSNASKAVLSTTDFNTVELMLTYDWEKGCYVSADCYVNGEYLLTEDISNKGLDYIDYFKMMQAYDANLYVDVDFVSVAKGHNSLYVAPEEPDQPIVPDEPVVSETTQMIGYQTTAVGDDGKYDFRLVAVLNDEEYTKYQKIGFSVKATVNGVTIVDESKDIKTLFKSIIAYEDSEYKEYSAEELGGAYIFAYNCLNIPESAGEITLEVTTYYQLVDSTDIVESTAVTFTVDPALSYPDISNVNVEA